MLPVYNFYADSGQHKKSQSQSLVSPQKVFFPDLNKLLCVDRGQWVMHNGVSYDLSQGQSHGDLKCAKMTNFKGCLLCRYACYQKTNGELWYSISAFFLDIFWYSSSFGVTWHSNLGCSTFDKRILLLTRSQLAVPYWAYFDVFDKYVTSCLVTRFLRNLWFCSLHSVTAGQPASLLVSCRLIIVQVCVHELLCHIVWAQFLDF